MTKLETLIHELSQAATQTPIIVQAQVVLTRDQVQKILREYQGLCWESANALRQLCH
ncbi:hypothetical protein [Desulfovibrio sp.]|uniref:hypothetical protein n=1 Tax=Desulfovibrio sp. TaxID=885 RepID=UPI0025BA5D73|nr:hypothetical protein [Desulfovibrio sp.]